MTLLRILSISALLLVHSCVAQQRPILGSATVATLSFSRYGQVQPSPLGFTIEYPCTETECNVDRFFEFVGPWPNGTYCIMYSSSQIAFYSVEISDGQKHGFERFYYVQGGIMRQQQYIQGMKTGLRFEFYPSGKLESLITFNGGNLIARYTFSEDQKSGTARLMVDGTDVSESWKYISDSVVVKSNP